MCWSVSPVDEVVSTLFNPFVDFSKMFLTQIFEPKILKDREPRAATGRAGRAMRLAHDGALELEQALLRHVAFEVELQQQIQVS